MSLGLDLSDSSIDSIPKLDCLFVYVTDACNCSCRHCWIVPEPQAGEKKRSRGRFLDLDLLEIVLIEAVALGLNSIKWTGGEPTIHPSFERLLDLQKIHGLSGAIETNGLNIVPSLVRRMIDTGIRHISVSLDGSRPETHDLIRGLEGAFFRTCRGIEILAAEGLRPQLILTLMRENLPELEAYGALAVRLGARSIKLNILQPMLRGEKMHETGSSLSIAELLSLRERIDRLRGTTGLAIFYGLPSAFRSLRDVMGGDGCGICRIKSILGLLSDGSYALCGIGAHIPELVFGRAGVDRLADIWVNHPILNLIRYGVPSELKGVCGRCVMKNICLGSCVAQNYYQKTDLLAPYWFCEEADRFGFFPDSRLVPGGEST